MAYILIIKRKFLSYSFKFLKTVFQSSGLRATYLVLKYNPALIRHKHCSELHGVPGLWQHEFVWALKRWHRAFTLPGLAAAWWAGSRGGVPALGSRGGVPALGSRRGVPAPGTRQIWLRSHGGIPWHGSWRDARRWAAQAIITRVRFVWLWYGTWEERERWWWLVDLCDAVDLVGGGVGPLPGRVLVGVVARAAGGRRGETAGLPRTPLKKNCSLD